MIRNRELGIECIRFSELLRHLYKYILHFQFEQRHACLFLQCRKTMFKKINPIPVPALQRYKNQILSASIKILTNAIIFILKRQKRRQLLDQKAREKIPLWMQDIFPNKTLNRSVCYSNMARIDSVTVSHFFYNWLVSGGRPTRLTIGYYCETARLVVARILIVFFLTFPVF